MTEILHGYNPNVRPLEQIETLHALIEIARYYPNSLHSVETNDDDDWWHIQQEHWNRTTLIIIEQDIVPTLPRIRSLENCSQPLCCYPYRLKDGNWSIFEIGPFVEGESAPSGAYMQLYYESIDQPNPNEPNFAEGSGFGLVKIAKEVQEKVDWNDYPISRFKWWYLDSWFSLQIHLLGYKWHVHLPPVKHNRNIYYNEKNQLILSQVGELFIPGSPEKHETRTLP